MNIVQSLQMQSMSVRDQGTVIKLMTDDNSTADIFQDEDNIRFVKNNDGSIFKDFQSFKVDDPEEGEADEADDPDEFQDLPMDESENELAA